MERVDYVEMTKSRYTSQFDYDPVFDAIIQTIVEYKMRVQDTYIEFAKTILDIPTSVGMNLDLIGTVIGQGRVLIDYQSKKYFGFEGNPRAEGYDVGHWYSLFSDSAGDSRTLTDDEYRRVLQARIIRNRTNCNRADFIKIVDLLMGIDRDNPKPNDPTYTIDEPTHGNIILTVSGVSDGIAMHYLSNIDRDPNALIPVPMGFRLSVKFTN